MLSTEGFRPLSGLSSHLSGLLQDSSHPDGMENASLASASGLCSHPTDNHTEDVQIGEVENKLGPSVRNCALVFYNLFLLAIVVSAAVLYTVDYSGTLARLVLSCGVRSKRKTQQ
jgi:hypothetical protein